MNPLAIALQGIGYGALLVAVQGLAPVQVNAALPSLAYYSVGETVIEARTRQAREEDDILLAIIQQFVMEEA